MSDTDPRQPGPGPLHAAADGTELAREVPGPADACRYRLAATDPLTPFCCGIGRLLAAAGYPGSGCTQPVTGCCDQEPGAGL